MEIEILNRENIPIIKEEENDLTLETLDNEPGYYQYVIRPMLQQGREEELYSWLKKMGLMRQSLLCQNSIKKSNCNIPMKWTSARIVDKFQWKCEQCANKRPIRDESFFNYSKCSLTMTIRVILGWCKDISIADMVEVLRIKQHLIKNVYEACTKIVMEYVRAHSDDWKMGGENTVVLVDLYPDGCAKVSGNNTNTQNNNRTQILCIAEVKSIPTNYWFHVLTSTDAESAKLEALEVVKKLVKPGSILVADSNAPVCSYTDLLNLKEYPTVVSVQNLMAHNRPNCNVLQNLETIWSSAIDICEEAQNYSQETVQSYLCNMVWRRKFSSTPSSALEALFLHIADCYPLRF